MAEISGTTGAVREHFGSRWAFYFAAVGSAVGFGNVWRFPALVFKYGSGAFFVPYLLALFLIGLPVLFLEIALGQYYQRGDISVFASFHKRMRGVGISSVSCGFLTLTYYTVLIAWVIKSLFESGLSTSPWSNADLNSTVAMDYFYNDVIGMSTVGENNLPTRLVGTNVGYSIMVFTLLFFCVGFGLKMTGAITYFTMGFPIILLFVFLIVGCTLEGSGKGIEAYIGGWDLSTLDGDAWSTAVTQIFFSLSLTFGIMTSYGSHMPREEPAFINSCVIAAANSTFSIIAGFAVFAALGNQAHFEGVEVNKLENAQSFGLVFGTWPTVFSRLPGGIHWVRLLLIFLVLLGIDSAFSFQEALMTVIQDTTMFRHTAKWKVALSLGITGFLLSIIYTTDAGLFFLDTIDFYINFVMLIVGFFETFAIGWIYDIEGQVDKFGSLVVFSFMTVNFGSAMLACIPWFGFGNVWLGFVVLILSYVLGVCGVIFLLSREPSTESLIGRVYDLYFGNIFGFKAKAEPVIKIVPTPWCILIKHFIPNVLLVLFVNLARSPMGFGRYGNYVTWPFQIFGILTFLFAVGLFLSGIIFPDLFAALDAPLELVDLKLAEEDEEEEGIVEKA